ncbi:MATE family efflux transporter [Methylobacterium organophilum]|uniref:MATE family efflux transporter n=1 Tax=Methylobacterium organophilum TaxID=410 RepID=UPI001F13450A|nr:MATE family efflux transporter [Methylobacterium organophilum]UMY18842.1 MATE family efflux transporter [Methylobacterium organophilum]
MTTPYLAEPASLRPGRRTPWRAELRATLALAAPLVLTNLAQLGLTASNTVLLGRLGAEPLAAGALATGLFTLLLIGGIGLTSAVLPLVAEAAGGDGDAAGIRRTVRAGFWAAALFTAPLMPVLWQAEPILLRIGQDPAVARDAGAYLRVLQWWMAPALLFMVLRGFLSALQRPAWPMAVSFAALPVNLGLGLFLAFGPPQLGIVGVGLATTLTECGSFAALALVVSLDPQLARYRLFAGLWRPDRARLRHLLGLGLPMAATGLAEAGLFESAAIMVGVFGATQLAAHAVTIQIAACCFMVPNGVGQAASVRVGRALGAGDRAALRRAGAVALALGLAFMALCALAQVTIPERLIGLFLDADAPGAAAVLPVAVSFLAISAVFAMADGTQTVALGALRGLQDTRVPMLIALAGYWGVGVPAGALLAWGAGLEGRGIWMGFCAGLLVVSVLLVARWRRLSRSEAGLRADA